MSIHERVTIIRRYDFEAAHYLPHVPDGHKCKRVHGHSYVVEVHVTGTPKDSGPEQGMVVDFGVLDAAADGLRAQVDHTPLHETLTPNPTVEMMAPFIYNHFLRALWEKGNGAGHPAKCYGTDLGLRIILHEGPRSACVYPPWAA